jgi:hypothetical protein
MARSSPSATSRRPAIAVTVCAVCMWPALSGQAADPLLPTTEFQVNARTDKVQQSASVALSAGGGFVVVWQSEVEGSGDEIRARRFDPRGLALGDEIAVNTVVRGNQNLPAVAMDARQGFVVAWQSLVAGNFVIRARLFDARGEARSDEITITPETGDNHGAAAVAMDARGNFVVAWESSIKGSYEIRARRFDADGKAQSEELAVNTASAGSQRAPCLAMDAGGNFVVAWRTNLAGSYELRARRFSASGAAQGDEFAVNARTAGDQLAPAVAMDDDGDFVVAWENTADGVFEIRARRFTAEAGAQGVEFAIAPDTAGEQFSPSLAMDARGAFVVAWQSKVAGSYEIRARRFDARGAARSAEIAVNTTTAGTQKAAAVAMDATGDFVVVWHGDATGSWEIFARRYPRRSDRSRS